MKEKKRFIIRKYVVATSALDALKKEKDQKADDCWLDETWQKEKVIRGFEQK